MDFRLESGNVGVYLLFEDVEVPRYATEGSACFDLKAYLKHVEHVSAYDSENILRHVPVFYDSVVVEPFMRVLVPTGMKFHIPVGFSMRIHPRSGYSLKSGLTIANCEGIIDYDYPEQTYIMAFNVSSVPVKISHGDRIAQGEILPVLKTEFRVLDHDITEFDSQYVTRASGFGHTGR